MGVFFETDGLFLRYGLLLHDGLCSRGGLKTQRHSSPFSLVLGYFDHRLNLTPRLGRFSCFAGLSLFVFLCSGFRSVFPGIVFS